MKKLKKGEYFGEISLLYDRKCTATIIARKYCNFACLSRLELKHMLLHLPFLEKAFRERVYMYSDNLVQLAKTCFRSLPFLKRANNQILYEFIFALRTHSHVKGDKLQEVGEEITSMYFVEKGMVEVILEV